MEDKNRETQKKEWVTPVLQVFGDMQTLTQQINKTSGLNDGVSFNGQTIGTT